MLCSAADGSIDAMNAMLAMNAMMIRQDHATEASSVHVRTKDKLTGNVHVIMG